jgi:hypothetical protein
MVLVAGGVLVLAALTGLVLGIGWLLPAKHFCARSAVYQQPPGTVWALITAPADYPQWRKDVRTVEVLSAERPLRWREAGGDRPLTFEVVQSDPTKRWRTKIVDKGLPFGGGWVFDLVPEGAGSRLTIREEGEVYNLFFRFMARFIFGYHRTLEAYLHAVGQKFGETVRPEVAPTWS